jgi:hypothetical protein
VKFPSSAVHRLSKRSLRGILRHTETFTAAELIAMQVAEYSPYREVFQINAVDGNDICNICHVFEKQNEV